MILSIPFYNYYTSFLFFIFVLVHPYFLYYQLYILRHYILCIIYVDFLLKILIY